jgi:hypothetical protein
MFLTELSEAQRTAETGLSLSSQRHKEIAVTGSSSVFLIFQATLIGKLELLLQKSRFSLCLVSLSEQSERVRAACQELPGGLDYD